MTKKELRKKEKMRLLYCIHQNYNGVGESYEFASFEAETKEGQKPDPQKMDRLIGMWKQLSKKTIKQWDIDGVGVYAIKKNRLVDYCLKFITNEELEAME